jgi:hypothetical protein
VVAATQGTMPWKRAQLRCSSDLDKPIWLKVFKNRMFRELPFGHSIDQNNNESCNLVSICLSWKLYFDGLTCREGQGIGVVLVSPRGAIFEQLVRLEYF